MCNYLEILLIPIASVGEPTGPVSGNPPPLSTETKTALTEATNSSAAAGTHAAGQDAGSKVGTAEAGRKVKSEKERTSAFEEEAQA